MARVDKVKINKGLVESQMSVVGLGSQLDLAEVAGLDYPNLNRILNGGAFASQTLGKLSRALKCHPAELIE